MLGQIRGIKCFRPEGAFYIFADCSDIIGKQTPQGKRLENDHDVVQYFLEDKGVAVIAGATFGLSPGFRISYATSMQDLENACTRLQEACSILKYN
ncbi:MAG: aminotransferase class I/II-fold pyridoxal phosphate-dependent enzyme, partial [Candidatus Nitrosotenuis sp.]